MTQPNSLLARVLKAKYFPSSDFMSSTFKVGASYAWRSLWASKKVLHDGLGWRVGIGEHIRIMSDNLILGSSNYKLLNPHINCELVHVADLIDSEKREWKAELITSLFYAQDAVRILRVPLANFSHDDEVIWRCEPSGLFSVKSACRLLVQEAQFSSMTHFGKKNLQPTLPSKYTI